jgi:hypothetical protein
LRGFRLSAFYLHHRPSFHTIRSSIMADTLTAQIKASLNWLFQESLDLATVEDDAKLEYDESLADGTADDQADKVWHDSRTLASGASDDLDLTALTNTIFGSTVTIDFVRIKAILIVNTATTAGEDLTVGGAAAQEWTAWVAAAGDKVRVPADSCLLITNKKTGWTVTDGASDTLRITNTGAGSITYKIAMLGTSA